MTISKENWVFLSMIQSQDFNVSLNICDKSCQTAKPHKSNFSNSSVYRILHGFQSEVFIKCLWENVKHRNSNFKEFSYCQMQFLTQKTNLKCK